MYQAASSSYDIMTCHRCGSSGLLLPAVSPGFWHNFGDTAFTQKELGLIDAIALK